LEVSAWCLKGLIIYPAIDSKLCEQKEVSLKVVLASKVNVHFEKRSLMATKKEALSHQLRG
jgi:hypothetical protein